MLKFRIRRKLTLVGMEIKKAYMRNFMEADSTRLGGKQAMKNESGRYWKLRLTFCPG